MSFETKTQSSRPKARSLLICTINYWINCRYQGAGGGLIRVPVNRDNLIKERLPQKEIMAKAQQQQQPVSAKAAAKTRVVKVDTYGDAHVTASFNNLIVSLTNKAGQVISWSSAGKMGFKGSKKNTPYAAQMAAGDAAKKAFDAGLKRVDVFVKGPGAGRESAIRAIAQSGIDVVMIKDVTPLPHNGCRPPKKRRV